MGMNNKYVFCVSRIVDVVYTGEMEPSAFIILY